MSDLQDLYQDMIIDHNRRPHNYRRLEEANRTMEGSNPLCGDIIRLDLKIEGSVITDVGFEGEGCAISRASASLMTDSIKGKTTTEADRIFKAFHRMITREPLEDSDPDTLGDLDVLSGVSEFPVRVKCAILSWHTLRSGLEGKHETTSTE